MAIAEKYCLLLNRLYRHC